MTPILHHSVLADEVVENLAPAAGEFWVDGTAGAGGHAALLLETVADLRLIAVDRDPTALELSADRLRSFGARVELVHGTFGELGPLLAERNIDVVDGILLDLGVSSMQLDRPERGFSFSKSGPIDMRMNADDDETALDLIRDTPTDALASIIRELGEERYAGRVAARLRAAVKEGALETTTDLARVIDEAIPAKSKRGARIHPATRTFQALRIALNRELEELDRFLDEFPKLLAPGGRCGIISFHSLEDRRVKHRFRELAWSSSLPRHLAEQAGERPDPICELVTRRAVVANSDEIAVNPRARSARLRVCRKV